MIKTALLTILLTATAVLADDRFGFATHFQQGWNTALLPAIAATGVGWIRDNYTSTDVYYSKAHAVGLKVCVIVGDVNTATQVVSNGWADAVEVTNEPNNIAQYQGRAGQLLLVQLTTAIDSAVHAINPGIPVIGLGSQGSAITYMLTLGGTMDGVVYHPYYRYYGIPESTFEPATPGSNPGGLWDDYEQWITEIRSVTTLPLWETEWGFQQGVYQPKLIARRLLEASGLAVDHTFIYEYQNNPSDPFGVVGTPTLPIVERIIAQLAGEIGTGDVTAVAVGNPNIKAYAYQGAWGTIISYWLGNQDLRTVTQTPTTATLTFTIPFTFGSTQLHNKGCVIENVLDGTSVLAGSPFKWTVLGNQKFSVTGVPVDDTPRMILIPRS